MVPLCTGNESTARHPPSPIDIKMFPFVGTISTFTRNIDTQTAVELPHVAIREGVVVTESIDHHHTPLKPPYRTQPPPTPGPGTYDIDYDRTAPRVSTTVLPSREIETKPITAFSTREVVKLFETRLRDVEPQHIQIPQSPLSAPEVWPNLSSTPSLCFKTSGHGDVFANNSPAKHLQAFDPPPPPTPAVPDLSRQSRQRPPVEKFSDRLYEFAVDQQLKVGPRTPNALRFEEQSGRQDKPQKNKRVELLDSLTTDQQNYIRQMTRKRKNQGRSSRRPLSTFERESGRPVALFPDEKVLSDDGPWPFDAIASHKKTIWREKIPAIHPRTREFVGPDFWQVHKGH
jgi:hypothetical protein